MTIALSRRLLGFVAGAAMQIGFGMTAIAVDKPMCDSETTTSSPSQCLQQGGGIAGHVTRTAMDATQPQN